MMESFLSTLEKRLPGIFPRIYLEQLFNEMENQVTPAQIKRNTTAGRYHRNFPEFQKHARLRAVVSVIYSEGTPL